LCAFQTSRGVLAIVRLLKSLEESAMTFLRAETISVEFPLYGPQARSFKRALFRTAVGGLIAKASNSDRVAVKGLQEISIDLKDGDRLALVGHNGAGKTTLLRVLAGIYHPHIGTVVSEGSIFPLFDIQAGFDDEATGYEN